jgi:peroxiredoxin
MTFIAALLPLMPVAVDRPPAVVRDFALMGADGMKHAAREWKECKAVVLIFLGTECPVSNGYAPEYRRLAGHYASKGVRFYGIHPDPDVTAKIAAKHAAEFGLPFPVLLDPAQRVARQAGITVVPSAVVLAPSGRILYRGRIDDRYALDGKRRDEPKRRDLEEAVRAALAGKPPPVAETPAFGCPLPQPLATEKDRPLEKKGR